MNPPWPALHTCLCRGGEEASPPGALHPPTPPPGGREDKALSARDSAIGCGPGATGAPSSTCSAFSNVYQLFPFLLKGKYKFFNDGGASCVQWRPRESAGQGVPLERRSVKSQSGGQDPGPPSPTAQPLPPVRRSCLWELGSGHFLRRPSP